MPCKCFVSLTRARESSTVEKCSITQERRLKNTEIYSFFLDEKIRPNFNGNSRYTLPRFTPRDTRAHHLRFLLTSCLMLRFHARERRYVSVEAEFPTRIFVHSSRQPASSLTSFPRAKFRRVLPRYDVSACTRIRVHARSLSLSKLYCTVCTST